MDPPFNGGAMCKAKVIKGKTVQKGDGFTWQLARLTPIPVFRRSGAWT